MDLCVDVVRMKNTIVCGGGDLCLVEGKELKTGLDTARSRFIFPAEVGTVALGRGRGTPLRLGIQALSKLFITFILIIPTKGIPPFVPPPPPHLKPNQYTSI